MMMIMEIKVRLIGVVKKNGPADFKAINRLCSNNQARMNPKMNAGLEYSSRVMISHTRVLLRMQMLSHMLSCNRRRSFSSSLT